MSGVKQLWAKLGDIPTTDECIEEEFNANGTVFEVGTDIFDIWYWFENHFSVSVAKDLMNLK